MATKSSKKVTPKNKVTKNVDKIQKTAKTVNSEIIKTANSVMDDLMDDGKELRALATKTAKEAAKKVKISKTVDKITKAAKVVNAQVRETTQEVLADAMTTGKKWSNDTLETAKEAIQNIDVAERLDSVKTTAKKVNKITLETADGIIDEVFTNGEKWQNLTEKAVKGGLKLAEKQQDIVFTTLETVKDQLSDSASRFIRLFR